MKNIKDSLIESLLGDVDDKIEDNSVIIEQYLKKYYEIKGKYIIHDGIVDIVGDIKVSDNASIKSLTDGFEFGEVTGSFGCIACQKIRSLSGAPKKVGGAFDCRMLKIRTLEGGPEEVGSFYCRSCPDLISLEGAPKTIKQDFDCSNCPKLKSLKGCPKRIGQNFWCSRNRNLIDLNYFPNYVGGDFDCELCSSLNEIPNSVYSAVNGSIYKD